MKHTVYSNVMSDGDTLTLRTNGPEGKVEIRLCSVRNVKFPFPFVTIETDERGYRLDLRNVELSEYAEVKTILMETVKTRRLRANDGPGSFASFPVGHGNKVKRRVVRGLVGTGTMVLCAALALFVPPLWEGVSGRDFRPMATSMAILIVLAGVAFRSLGKWEMTEFIVSLVGGNMVTLGVIAHISGSRVTDVFDWFNLTWLGFMNLFIGLPWAVGFGIGSGILHATNETKPNPVPEDPVGGLTDHRR